MDFKLTEEQQMLQETAARLVRDTYTFDKREKASASDTGFSPEFWQQMGELGLTAIPFPEELGGFGGTGVENMLIMKELGRGICLEPYMESVIFAGGLITQLGSDSQKDELLAGIASGELQAAVALDEPNSHYQLAEVQTTAKQQGDSWSLTGRKAVVIGGHTAGKILVSARTAGDLRDQQGISLFIVDPTSTGVKRRNYATVDGRKGCELFLDNAQGELLGQAGEAFDAIQYQAGRAIAALCAEAVGVADEADNAERTRTLTAAKFMINRCGRKVAEEAIQLHGGIAMTWEYSLAHYAKRLVMISHQLGDDDHHLEAYAKQMSVA